MTPVGSTGDDTIGGLMGQLIDDGKAYVRAEIDVVKATASGRIRAVRGAVAIGIAAIFVLQAGLTVLFVAIGHVLALLIGIWAGMLLAALLALGLAGAMAWYAATHFSPVAVAPTSAETKP